MIEPLHLHQFSKQAPCYYCGAPPPSGREHVPPRMMFSAFLNDSITVPACREHNLHKGTDDRALATAMALLAHQAWRSHLDTTKLTPNVIKAIQATLKRTAQAKNQVSLRAFLADPAPGLDLQWPYIMPGVEIGGWIRQLTAALVWSVFGRYEPAINWEETWVWSPNYASNASPISREQAAERAHQKLEFAKKLDAAPWYRGWSSQPRPYPEDIYSFEIALIPPGEPADEMVMFRHRFYNSTCTWYAVFPAFQEVKSCIARAVARNVSRSSAIG